MLKELSVLATIQTPDPIDERVGVWFSREDIERLYALGSGKKLVSYDDAMAIIDAHKEEHRKYVAVLDKLSDAENRYMKAEAKLAELGVKL